MSNSLRNVQALIIVDVQAAFVSGDEAVPEAAGLLLEGDGSPAAGSGDQGTHRPAAE